MAKAKRNHLALPACLVVVVVALWVHRRALGVFFSPDDLIAIERVRGLLPPHPVPLWRFLSGPAYFGTALRLFGTDPLPYHVVNWLLHGLNVALLFTLARRWGASVAGAAVAALAFGASRIAAPALLQAVGIGELLALAGALAALLVVDANRPRRIGAACALFALALSGKEGVLLLPLVLLLPVAPAAPARRRIAAAGFLLAPGVAWISALALLGARGAAFGGEAYATAFGANLFHNLMTYAAWCVDLVSPTPDVESGIVTSAWRTGLWVIVAAVAVVALRRRVTAAAGAAWFGLALAPVLPLLHHTYLQYAYAASAGLALVAGDAWEGLVGRLTAAASPLAAPSRRPARHGVAVSRRRVWVVAASTVAIAVAYVATVNGTLARRWAQRLEGLELARDPALRKAELARNASESLGRAIGGRRVRLVLVSPPESQVALSTRTGRGVDAGDVPNLLAQVLDGGRALRALHPGIDSLAFVDRWTSDHLGFDLAASSREGRIVDFGQGPDAHVKLVTAMLRGGFTGPALEHLEAATAAFPDDPRLRALRAAADARARG